MPATSSRRQIARRLEQYQRTGGNWRLKGLLLALSETVDARAVGRAWPKRRPQTPREYVNLGFRNEDTHEYNLAREEWGSDAIRAGEWIARDDYIARGLASGTERELDVLWREELLATVIAGASTRKIARVATTETPVGARKGDLPTPGQEPFADSTAEGSNPLFDEEDYSQTAYNCEKFEEGFAISDNLVEAGEVDIIERHIEYAGAAVENAINRQHLINVVDNANQNNGSVGNEATVQTVLEAMENVADNDFDPVDTAILHPELVTELADDPALGILDFSRRDRASDRELQDGEGQEVSSRALAPEIFVASDATYNGLSSESSSVSGTNTWGWESASEIGGVVYGRPFVRTVVYQDIDVSELEPPFTAIYDLQGGVARAWTDSVQASNNAISKITQ